jgi:hypothetical protein
MVSPSSQVAQATLTIVRNSPDDIKMRDLYVSIDDLPEWNLQFADTRSIQLSAGEHRVKITNRLFSKSESFTLVGGQSVSFRVANIPAGALFAPLMVIGGMGGYKVRIERA